MEKRLSDLKPGEKGIITRVEGPGALKRRLLDMGLVKGTEVTMIRRAPLGDPIEFLVKGYSLSLREVEANSIYVSTNGGPQSDDRHSTLHASRRS